MFFILEVQAAPSAALAENAALVAEHDALLQRLQRLAPAAEARLRGGLAAKSV